MKFQHSSSKHLIADVEIFIVGNYKEQILLGQFVSAPNPHLGRLLGQLLALVFVVQIHAVLIGNVHPSGGLNVVDTNDTTRIRIPMGRMIDGTSAQLLRLLIRQIPLVTGVQNTERVHRSTADGEQLALGARSLRVDVVETGTAFVVSSQHHAHAQAGAFVLVSNVGHNLGGSGH